MAQQQGPKHYNVVFTAALKFNASVTAKTRRSILALLRRIIGFRLPQAVEDAVNVFPANDLYLGAIAEAAYLGPVIGSKTWWLIPSTIWTGVLIVFLCLTHWRSDYLRLHGNTHRAAKESLFVATPLGLVFMALSFVPIVTHQDRDAQQRPPVEPPAKRAQNPSATPSASPEPTRLKIPPQPQKVAPNSGPERYSVPSMYPAVNPRPRPTGLPSLAPSPAQRAVTEPSSTVSPSKAGPATFLASDHETDFTTEGQAPPLWWPMEDQKRDLIGMISETPQAFDEGGIWLSQLVTKVNTAGMVRHGWPPPNTVNYPAALSVLARDGKVLVLEQVARTYTQSGDTVWFTVDLRFRAVPSPAFSPEH